VSRETSHGRLGHFEHDPEKACPAPVRHGYRWSSHEKENVVKACLHCSAGVLEVGWALGAEIFRRADPVLADVATLIAIALSFSVDGARATVAALGTAYAVWTGIGAVVVSWVACCSTASRPTLLDHLA